MSSTFLNDVRIPAESEVSDYFELMFRGQYSPHSINVMDYEDGVIGAHGEITNVSDTVVIVGGGWGISAVRAATCVGPQGQVIVYEGGQSEITTLRQVIKENEASGCCDAYHTVVGPDKGVYSDPSGADRITPGEIPPCNVLELDCEGSEIEILESLNNTPDAIIMELHPWEYPDQPHKPLTLLGGLGYEICYRAGHDGRKVGKEGFQELLDRSAEEKGSHKPDRTGPKYLDGGARWPVVVGASLED